MESRSVALFRARQDLESLAEDARRAWRALDGYRGGIANIPFQIDQQIAGSDSGVDHDARDSLLQALRLLDKAAASLMGAEKTAAQAAREMARLATREKGR